MTDLALSSATELLALYRRKQASPIEAVEAALALAKESEADANGRIGKLMGEMAAASKDKHLLQASVDELAVAIVDAEKRREAAEARVAEFKSTSHRSVVPACRSSIWAATRRPSGASAMRQP